MMPRDRVWFGLRLALVNLALIAAAWLGIKEGIESLHGATTAGQRLAADTQITYGGTALLGLVGLLSRGRWALGVLMVWAVALTATATLAPVVWGGAAWWSGALTGAITAVIALLVFWGAAAHLRAARAEKTP